MSDTVIIFLAVTGILVLIVFLVVWLDRADKRNRATARAALAFHEAASTITELERVLTTQIEELGYVNPQPLFDLIKEYRERTDRKELQ